ncbi:bifunctional riboflavin kinase/FAD synthetase [Bacteroidota bacterium]
MPHTLLEDVGAACPTVLTVGVFDGVHLGHRTVIQRVVAAARRLGARSCVITFEPHPQTVLAASSIPLLSTTGEKSALLMSEGIDIVVVVPFDLDLSNLSARDFISDILIHKIGLIHLIIGYDHALGKGASGNASVIVQIGKEFDFTLEIIEPQADGGRAYSSSQIREILARDGNVADAKVRLGRMYELTGKVVHGDGRGKGLGFPTANLELDHTRKLVPANGVYAVTVTREANGSQYDGIMNIGVRPTLTSGMQRVLEAHLLEFDDDLYDEMLTIHFVDRIRDERKFDGVEELTSQIQYDLADCIRLLASLS